VCYAVDVETTTRKDRTCLILSSLARSSSDVVYAGVLSTPTAWEYRAMTASGLCWKGVEYDARIRRRAAKNRG